MAVSCEDKNNSQFDRPAQSILIENYATLIRKKYIQNFQYFITPAEDVQVVGYAFLPNGEQTMNQNAGYTILS